MPMSVWTSTLNRTIQTAEGLPFPKLRWKVLPCWGRARCRVCHASFSGLQKLGQGPVGVSSAWGAGWPHRSPMSQAGMALCVWPGRRTSLAARQRCQFHPSRQGVTCGAMQVLDEIQAGIFDGWTYAQIEKERPEEFAARKADKLRYR